MGTVSVSLPSDGQTIDAADYNTPINTIVTEINGSLDSDNIAEGGVVPNSLTDGTGTSWVWQDWTPTYTNLTEGNGTTVAKYTQIGKTVFFRFSFTFGSTSSVSNNPSITFPVTINTGYNIRFQIGDCWFSDATGGDYSGYINQSGVFYTLNTSTTYSLENGIGATTPFTWATGDTITAHGFYEAA